MANRNWLRGSIGVLALAACGQQPPEGKSPPDAGSTTKGPDAAFEQCLRDNGWAVPDTGRSWSNHDLAVRIAAVKARCQPSDEALEDYVRRLTGNFRD